MIFFLPQLMVYLLVQFQRRGPPHLILLRHVRHLYFYRVFQDFESPTSLNLPHCKQLQCPNYCLFNSTHNSSNNSEKHSSKNITSKGNCKSENSYYFEWQRFKHLKNTTFTTLFPGVIILLKKTILLVNTIDPWNMFCKSL